MSDGNGRGDGGSMDLGFEQFRVAVWHWLPDSLSELELSPAMTCAVERTIGREVTVPKRGDPLWANAAIEIMGWALANYAKPRGLPLSATTIQTMLSPTAFARLAPVMRSRIVHAAEAEAEK